MYELIQLWNASDNIIRSVAIFLLLLSLASWTVILSKAWDAFQIYRLDEQIFWQKDSFAHGLDSLGARSNNPFRLLALTAYDATAPSHSQLHDRLPASEWIARCLKNTSDDLFKKMEHGLTLLASIGATAPFIGLFGTVWGIYHALLSMSTSGTATIDKVAGPVGEALIMTALGLAVAIPAVLGYNALTRVNKNAAARLYRFAADLHAYFVADVQSKDTEHI